MEVDAKVVDVAILATPIKRGNGFKVVAYFTLLLRPMRIEDCKLAITPKGKFVLWTPDEAIKIAGWARDELAGTARLAYVEAQKRIGC
tara:strand:- start:274 stop:537 length:264 start_codon:yes stop_codon:yes gene_type:complete